MNQNDKEAAKSFTNGMKSYIPIIPTRQTVKDEINSAFLAGIQYERNRQSEVNGMKFSEWLADQKNIDDPNQLYRSEREKHFCIGFSRGYREGAEDAYKAAYAQGMKDAKEKV